MVCKLIFSNTLTGGYAIDLHVLEKQQLTQSLLLEHRYSPYRPSDDAQQYGFLVPSNMFAVSALRMVVEMAENLWHDTSISNSARDLANDIETGIRQYGIVQHKGKQIYAYEVDGLGHYNLMDDANIPSLMAIRTWSLSLSLLPTHTHTQTQSTHSIHRTRRVRS